MSGVKKSKARKMQAVAARSTHRTVKGRNKVRMISRTDPKKKGGKAGGRIR